MKKKPSPKVKDVLELLAKGAFLTSLFLFPGAAIGIKAIIDTYDNLNKKRDYDRWNTFSHSQLRHLLRRLHKQKVIKVIRNKEYPEVHLTQKGRLKVLSYKLEELNITKPKRWDKKWRLIIYDISKFKKRNQAAFRRMLKKLHMLPLQKSVYLTPYPCEKEITFLKEYFDIGEEVLYVIAKRIENEEAYKKYFNLN